MKLGYLRKLLGFFEIKEETPSLLNGNYKIKNFQDKNLLEKFGDKQLVEIADPRDGSLRDIKDLEIGSTYTLLISTAEFSGYFRSFKVFLNSNTYQFNEKEIYIRDIDYHHNVDSENELFTNYKKVTDIIEFLRKLCSYERDYAGDIELIFHNPDKICIIPALYNVDILKGLAISEPLEDVESHVLSSSDKDSRSRLFINELVNGLSKIGFSFKNLVDNWDTIVGSYYKSHEIYLSEFSYKKIKMSSQQDFHDLTDRIYSTISKFSGYILALPVAYILILRFLDYDGLSFIKDIFLLTIGGLYFITIWYVFLQNLDNGFTSIEKDINRFLNRISDNEHLKEISDDLETKKNQVIPAQKKKICIVKVVSVLIMLITVAAFLYIYGKKNRGLDCKFILSSANIQAKNSLHPFSVYRRDLCTG